MLQTSLFLCIFVKYCCWLWFRFGASLARLRRSTWGFFFIYLNMCHFVYDCVKTSKYMKNLILALVSVPLPSFEWPLWTSFMECNNYCSEIFVTFFAPVLTFELARKLSSPGLAGLPGFFAGFEGFFAGFEGFFWGFLFESTMTARRQARRRRTRKRRMLAVRRTAT